MRACSDAEHSAGTVGDASQLVLDRTLSSSVADDLGEQCRLALALLGLCCPAPRPRAASSLTTTAVTR